MKAALYARVSRADQQTLPEQLSQMRDYCKARGWEVVHEFQETMSGSKDSRPQRKQVLALANQRQIDCIVVWKLDRWGRSLGDIVLTLADIHAKGCGFVSITQDIDFTTPTGKMLAGILASIAEFERATLIERTKMGLANAVKKGKKLGRRPIPTLYREEILFYAAEGLSAPLIVEAMESPDGTRRVSEATVRRVLRGEKIVVVPWIDVARIKPPQGEVIETKIDDAKGRRNVKKLCLRGAQWWEADLKSKVRYKPTHWRRILKDG